MVDANRKSTLLTCGAGRQGVWNLSTGQFQIVIRYLSWAINHPDASAPIEGLLDGYPIAVVISGPSDEAWGPARQLADVTRRENTAGMQAHFAHSGEVEVRNTSQACGRPAGARHCAADKT